MITREEIRDLAEFQSAQGCAVTFYYQPDTPQNQSHREEAILVKDLVRGALREVEKEGRNGCARADLERILELAERLHGNGGKTKAIFADASQNFWREYDVPVRLDRTQLIVNRRFHLKPLAPVLEVRARVCVCVVDRTKARLFDYQNREDCREVIDFFTRLPRESEGWKGYGAGHIERHVSEFAKQHYKQVADTILKFFERGSCQSLIIGIRDENRADFESVLHPYLKRNLIGRFHGDPATATPQQIADNVERLLREYELERRQALVREALAEAQRKAHGAVGLRHVLQSLEKGEVQTLLLGDRFQAPGAECRHCGHVDMKAVSSCPVCAHPTVVLDDISDAILGFALRNGAEVVYVREAPEFESAGNIAALLRFRAEESKAAELAS